VEASATVLCVSMSITSVIGIAMFGTFTTGHLALTA
jgi:hypothetical protein